MKKIRRFLLFSLIALFSLGLTACFGDDDNGDSIDTGDGGSTPTRNIVLSYADWGDQEMNQYLIDEFMKVYPNIRVELRKDISGHGEAFTLNLINAQMAGILPDVFAIDNVPVGIGNGLVGDVAEFWDADPDTAYVYPNVAETAVYNGKRLAMPSFQFMRGVFINVTLLEKYNIPLPSKDWHYQDMIDLAIQIRQMGQNDMVYGLEPRAAALDFHNYFPSLDDADIGYMTWDGTQFNFNTPAWIEAFNTSISMWDQGVVASFTDEEVDVIGDVWPWFAGYVGMSIDGSWMMWQIDHMFEQFGQEVVFWPYPKGDAGQFPPVVLDYVVISSDTDHPYESYLLAKWMTFGRLGWQARLELMGERGNLYLDRFPVADYPEIWTQAENFIDYIEGLRENVELLAYGIPDVDKWLIGHREFWIWVGNEDNDYWTRIGEGLITPETFAAEWQQKINELVTEGLNFE